MKSIGFALTLFAATLSAQSPSPAPQVFRSTTDLVPVDVRVLDKNGKPIEWLTASDFTILEDGVRQPIRHFSVQMFAQPAAAATAHAEPPAASAGTPASDPMPAQERRVFLLILGRGHLQRVMNGVDGVLHFVRERAQPNDLVAVLAWNRATEFTTDRTRLLDVLERFKKDHDRIESLIAFRQAGPAAFYRPLSPEIQAQIDAVFGLPGERGVRTMPTDLGPQGERTKDDIRQQRQAQLDALPALDPKQMDDAMNELDAFMAQSSLLMNDISATYAGIEYLRRMNGEKHIVFVSENGFLFNRLEEGEAIAQAASDARIAFDYFHTQGTTLSKIGQQSSFGAERNRIGSFAAANSSGPPSLGNIHNQVDSWRTANAQMMSELTGGQAFIHEFKNVAGGLDRLDESTRADYLLGYYPSNPRMDGRYRKIQVVVNRPGATVEYRHGYFARAAAAPPDIKRMMTFSRIAAAANFVAPITDIKVAATASLAPDKSGVHVELTIDPSRLSLTKREGRNVGTIEIATFLVDAHDRTLGQLWKSVDITLTDADLDTLKRDGAKVRVLALMRGEPKKAKVIVYDAGADLVGSTTVDVK